MRLVFRLRTVLSLCACSRQDRRSAAAIGFGSCVGQHATSASLPRPSVPSRSRAPPAMHLTMSCAPALAARRALSRSLSVPAALPRVRASAGAVRTYSSALDTVKEKISSEKVVVFSKSYCPCVPRS